MKNRRFKRSMGQGRKYPVPNHDEYGRPKQSAIQTMNENSAKMAQSLEELEKDNVRDSE